MEVEPVEEGYLLADMTSISSLPLLLPATGNTGLIDEDGGGGDGDGGGGGGCWFMLTSAAA